mgnify:CR=1 FL=1
MFYCSYIYHIEFFSRILVRYICLLLGGHCIMSNIYTKFRIKQYVISTQYLITEEGYRGVSEGGDGLEHPCRRRIIGQTVRPWKTVLFRIK